MMKHHKKRSNAPDAIELINVVGQRHGSTRCSRVALRTNLQSRELLQRNAARRVGLAGVQNTRLLQAAALTLRSEQLAADISASRVLLYNQETA